MELGPQDFRRRHPDATFGAVLVLIASYLEADNIGDVLKAVPADVARPRRLHARSWWTEATTAPRTSWPAHGAYVLCCRSTWARASP